MLISISYNKLACYLRWICSLIFILNTFHLSLSQENVKLSPSKKLSQFPIKAWDMDKGMPSDMVIGITQCPTGYIWLATYKGITRFDGVNFKVYNNNTSEAIQSITTQATTVDSEGNVWFASQKGLVKYSNYLFVRDPNLVNLNNTSVEALYFDNDRNTLWIGTTSEGVFRYKSKQLEAMPAYREISRGVVKTINGDLKGNIWIGSEGGRVVKFDGESFFDMPSNIRMGGIGSFYSNRSGDFWVATEHGVFKLIDKTLVHQKNIPVENANVIIEDSHNSLWIGTENGLYRYHFESGILDQLNEENGLPNNLVKDIFPDNEGNLWVATYRKGIVKLTDGLITNFSVTEGLSSDLITSIVQVGDNKFYVADEYGLINIIEDEKISELKIKNNISRDRLKNIFYDSNKNLWISTYGGLLKVEPNGNEVVYNYTTGFPAETIRLTYEDNEGNIWIGTRSNGLFKVDSEGAIKEFSLKTGFSSNYIMAVTQDKLGRILVSTKNGIDIIYNNRIEKVLTVDTGLPSNFTFNIHVDSSNVFWAASNDGIIRIENDEEIFVFNTQNGLFDNTLFDILEDDFGFLWMPTDIGIVCISKDELNNFAKGTINSYSYKIFGRSDGMKNPRCTGATKSIKSTDGRLIFTTSGGVSIVNPKDVVDEKSVSKILIESMVVNGRIILPSQPFNISPGNNRLQINYTAINFKESEKLRFRYRLEPFDSQWIEAETERVAQYTNVPPGDYLFTVQATTNEGNWSQTPVSVSIFVDKIWWKTWWFRISLAFVMAFSLWLIYKARIYSVKLHQAELERLVRERTALINQQKKELELQSRELEKLSIVASHTNNAIMMTSPTGDILWVNESFTRIYGYTLEEFIGEYGSNLALVSNDSNISYMIEKCINEKTTSNYTVQVKTKDGGKLWIQTTLTPVKNDDGSVRVIIAIDTDITELKQVESEMISLNNEIMMQSEAMLQQNEEIQTQRDELEQVNNLLFKHNQNIESSIWYAYTIQKAILPSKNYIDQHFENFIVFKPRDIVSGDFYWFTRLTVDDLLMQKFIIAVVDCTGHGVPGALMSMIGSRLISEIVNEKKITDPAQILSQLNRLINIVLKQETVDNIDGMDVSLCLVEKESNNHFSITFSGANRPVYILKSGSTNFETAKGNRKSIGGIMPDLDAEFLNHSFKLSSGDMIFMNTDGYIDQNAEGGKKLSVAKFHELILEKSDRTMKEIGEHLDVAFDVYRGKQTQRDDATVLGIRF